MNPKIRRSELLVISNGFVAQNSAVKFPEMYISFFIYKGFVIGAEAAFSTEMKPKLRVGPAFRI